MSNSKPKPHSGIVFLFQLILTFVLPILVLMKLSGPETLGQVKSLMLALSFPIVYELARGVKHRKISGLSLLSIAGILVTGALSFLKVSATWLAIRRSVPYLCIAGGLLVAYKLGYPIAEKAVGQILDLNKINNALKNPQQILQPLFRKCTYFASGSFGLVALLNYILTKKIVTAPLSSTEFNQQYAQLRLLSIPFITLPLLIGLIGIVWYVITKLEKATDMEVEELMKAK